MFIFGKINNARKIICDFIEKNGIKLKVVGNNQKIMCLTKNLLINLQIKNCHKFFKKQPGIK